MSDSDSTRDNYVVKISVNDRSWYIRSGYMVRFLKASWVSRFFSSDVFSSRAPYISSILEPLISVVTVFAVCAVGCAAVILVHGVLSSILVHGILESVASLCSGIVSTIATIVSSLIKVALLIAVGNFVFNVLLDGLFGDDVKYEKSFVETTRIYSRSPHCDLLDSTKDLDRNMDPSDNGDMACKKDADRKQDLDHGKDFDSPKDSDHKKNSDTPKTSNDTKDLNCKQDVDCKQNSNKLQQNNQTKVSERQEEDCCGIVVSDACSQPLNSEKISSCGKVA